jgi:hypothetical protein
MATANNEVNDEFSKARPSQERFIQVALKESSWTDAELVMKAKSKWFLIHEAEAYLMLAAIPRKDVKVCTERLTSAVRLIWEIESLEERNAATAYLKCYVPTRLLSVYDQVWKDVAESLQVTSEHENSSIRSAPTPQSADIDRSNRENVSTTESKRNVFGSKTRRNISRSRSETRRFALAVALAAAMVLLLVVARPWIAGQHHRTDKVPVELAKEPEEVDTGILSAPIGPIQQNDLAPILAPRYRRVSPDFGGGLVIASNVNNSVEIKSSEKIIFCNDAYTYDHRFASHFKYAWLVSVDNERAWKSELIANVNGMIHVVEERERGTLDARRYEKYFVVVFANEKILSDERGEVPWLTSVARKLQASGVKRRDATNKSAMDIVLEAYAKTGHQEEIGLFIDHYKHRADKRPTGQ